MSAGKSGSDWLARLRSSRGFPADHDLNLEQFLNHTSPYFSNSSSDAKFPDSTTTNNGRNSNNNSTLPENLLLNRKQTTEIRPENGDRKWFGITSSVLSELFIMGESNDFRRKKSSRKQLNPKIGVAPTSPNVEYFQTEKARSPSSDNNNSKKENTNQAEVLNCVGLDIEDAEEDKCHADLSTFSRTEVTVIDTSCGSWKFEKMLFKRKNVWKVRDKKCKGMINVGRKKRKASTLLSEDTLGNEKKPKLYLGQCCSSNVAAYAGLDQSEMVVQACKDGPDKFGRSPRTRLPRKLKKGSSSVILIKSIPTTKKNCRSNPKSFQKSTSMWCHLQYNK